MQNVIQWEPRLKAHKAAQADARLAEFEAERAQTYLHPHTDALPPCVSAELNAAYEWIGTSLYVWLAQDEIGNLLNVSVMHSPAFGFTWTATLAAPVTEGTPDRAA